MRHSMVRPPARQMIWPASRESLVTVFLCGDVMTGRGLDQILPHPGDPTLHEPVVRDAREYVELAERQHGRIQRGVEFDYVWGDGLVTLREISPHARIINLETAVTISDDWWRGKQVHYRMHPENVQCLTAAGVDCAVLANNHVLDWGYAGLDETLRTLEAAGVALTGAGRRRDEALRPAVFALPGSRRLLVFGVGSVSSGIPPEWEVTDQRPGVHLIDESEPDGVSLVADLIGQFRRAGDIVIVSIHWGPNWGYEIPASQRTFAHALIDRSDVHIVHGHSSHHIKGIEVYNNRPILYGCGDLLTDYEGIRGYASFRGDLGLMYFVTMNVETGDLVRLDMSPTQVRSMQLRRPSGRDVARVVRILNREGRRLGSRVERRDDDVLMLRWD